MSEGEARPLAVLLLLTVAAPALAIGWGFENGSLAFVLYREPKLITVSVLGWTLVSVLSWRFRSELSLGEVRKILRLMPLRVLAILLGYLATTGFWVRVPENYWYELNQYLLLFVLLVALLIWQDRDPSVARTVRTGVVMSLAIVSIVGLVQAAVPIPFLSPINPQIGAAHPSFMGYKNPAALAVLGQVFLLAGLAFTLETPNTGQRRRRLLLGALLALELVYLVSLGSRTSILALVTASLYLAGLWWIRAPTLRRALRSLSVVGLAFGVSGVMIFANDDLRRRAASMAEYISHPISYLDSDRGTYLLNTLAMVRHNPMGVGLGDWQTQYPVYRAHHPARSFSSDFQVRRAHSDHVQFFGEAGWPGLVLWGLFLCTLIWFTSREFLATGRLEPLFVSTQLVAFAAAMATDYVIELPYNKAQFFLVVFLAIQTCRPNPRSPSLKSSRGFLAIALMITVLALGQVVLHTALARKVHLAAHLEHSYSTALQMSSSSIGGTDAASFVRPYSLGADFVSMFGHTKTFHKDWLIFAHCAEKLERHSVALAATRKALDLHPYYPPAYLLMSHLEDDPTVSERWASAYEHLMRGPTDGSVDGAPLALR